MHTSHWSRAFNQYRFFMLVLSFVAFGQVARPALYMLTSDTSIDAKVAGLLRLPIPVSWVFVFGALALIPNLIVVLFKRNNTCNRRTVKMACFGLAVSSFNFLGLAYIGRNIDRAWFVLEYVQHGVTCLLLAIAYAMVLNNDLADARR